MNDPLVSQMLVVRTELVCIGGHDHEREVKA
jgi:hypothetical protein